MMFNYDWKLSDLPPTGKYRAISIFSGGGGSTMGLKLNGVDVIGCVELDKRMMDTYLLNFNPRYPYNMMVQDFKHLTNIHSDLYDLDILDGSPPCSSFSTLGNREKDWGKEKKFREGQAKQILDTLFFDFIDVASVLKPKIVVAENVKGLLIGNAKSYVDRIIKHFNYCGYDVRYYLLNSMYMGVPQRRERVFFVAVRKDLSRKVLKLDVKSGQLNFNLDFNFKLKPIPFKVVSDYNDTKAQNKYTKQEQISKIVSQGSDFSRMHELIFNKGNMFGYHKLCYDEVCPTLDTRKKAKWHPEYLRMLNFNETLKIGSWPSDYNFGNSLYDYIIGMSVPPVMSAYVYNRILKGFNRILQ